MKFLHICYHFEFSENIEEILDNHSIDNYVRYPKAEGKDQDGKHFGSKVHPGSSAVVQAQVPDHQVDPLLKALKKFKQAKKAHMHLQAFVLPIEVQLD